MEISDGRWQEYIRNKYIRRKQTTLASACSRIRTQTRGLDLQSKVQLPPLKWLRLSSATDNDLNMGTQL